MIVVHVTHEAVEQIGGIGTVIAGLTTTDAYAEEVSRTLLLGPLLQTDRPADRRLGEGGTIIYSSLDAVEPPEWTEKFRPIERTYDVGIIYGTRAVTEACTQRSVDVEVLLVDVFHSNPDRLNLFKGELFKKFAIPSHDIEHIWEYEQYVRLAEPGHEALRAVGVDGSTDGEPVLLLAHEYMGVPTALKAVLDGSRNTTTVFYAHEVASVREIVENTPGHDTMFYNALRAARQQDLLVEDLFPRVHGNFKHPVVKAARYCDEVFAVGDYVVDEIRFLDRHFETMDIDLVYNGIPSRAITYEQRQASRQRMKTYAATLLGFEPTWIFTHVARPVMSKGIWRDIGVLRELEGLLAERGETAVFFMLGTLAGQRRGRDVRQMERVYGWPVAHEIGYPDLSGGEEGLAEMFDGFNRNYESVRAILVNQFGWEPPLCGTRMPADMTFTDIRAGSDLELGLSIYEPFGISQLEPLCFGALCATSNVCGCMGFARRALPHVPGADNIIEADFLGLGDPPDLAELVHLPAETRNAVEAEEFARLAREIADRLPRDEAAIRRRIEHGSALAARMGWESVVREYFLPGLGRATEG